VKTSIVTFSLFLKTQNLRKYFLGVVGIPISKVGSGHTWMFCFKKWQICNRYDIHKNSNYFFTALMLHTLPDYADLSMTAQIVIQTLRWKL